MSTKLNTEINGLGNFHDISDHFVTLFPSQNEPSDLLLIFGVILQKSTEEEFTT